MMFDRASNLLSKILPKSKRLLLNGASSSFVGYHSTGISFTSHPITCSTRNEVMKIYNPKNVTEIASANMASLGIELKEESAICTSKAKLHGKVAVVTGSNTGIGKETAADLAGRGARVILACFNMEDAEAAKMEILERFATMEILESFGELECHHLDLASFKSVRKFAEKLAARERKLDILVNNSGGIQCAPRKITEDGQELTMQVNHLGHFLLTNLLLDLLKASGNARVVSVSSRVHELVKNTISWDDIKWEKNPWSEWEAYSQSKLAVILFSRELSRRFHGTGINTYCVHPGVVHTEIDISSKLPDLPIKVTGQKNLQKNSKRIKLTPEQGAQTTIYCCVDEELGAQTGQYYTNCAQVNPSKEAQDDEAAEKLWAVSEEVVGDITPNVPAGRYW